MRVVIAGGRGQLAADLRTVLGDAVVAAPGRSEMDVSVPEQVQSMLDSTLPDALINTAAFHQVDLCESEPEQSFAVNAAAPQRKICRRHQPAPQLL